MLLPLLAGAPALAQEWDAPSAMALVDRAVAFRARADTTLHAYTAEARGILLFLGDLGGGLLGGSRVIKAEQLATRLTWRAPGFTEQRIVGQRDTLLLPGDVGFYRDRYGVITNNLGDRIRLGDARDVRDLPHPLSIEGRPLHEFALADSLAISLPGRRVDAYVLDVRPRDLSAPGVAGSIVLERETGAVVRMALTFTPAALLDRRIERLTLVLENALIEGRYWLPFRQEMEVVRGSIWLDFPVKGIVRARWEVCCYTVMSDPASLPPVDATASVVLAVAGNRVVMAPVSERSAHQWETPLVEALRPDLTLASEREASEVRRRAERMVAQRMQERTTRSALRATSASDFLHVNRVEGVALGAGATVRLVPRWSMTLGAGYGFSDDRMKADLTLSYRPTPSVTLEAFGQRRYRSAEDLAEASGVRNTIAAQAWGEDATDLYDTWGGGVRARIQLDARATLDITAARERQEPLRVNAEPWSGTYLPTIAARPVVATSGEVAVSGRGWAGPLGSSLSGKVTLRAGHLDPRVQNGPNVGLARLAGSGTMDIPLGAETSLFAELHAGVVGGGAVPPQELIRYGGIVSGPGYPYHRFAGRSAVALRIEPRLRVPFVKLPTVIFQEKSPPWATLAPYGHVVCTDDGDPRYGGASGCYPAVGVGLSIVYDVIRFDLARGLRDGQWTLGVDAARMFWGIL